MTTATIKQPTNNNSLDDGLGFLIREPAEVYHSNAADYLSSHALRNFRR